MTEAQTTTAVAGREIAGLIENAKNLQERLREANNNLSSIHRRLFTQPPESVKEPSADTPEPVRSELEQLHYLLDEVDREINRTFELADGLDRI